MEAALEAATANLLGGLGDFSAISGANTAFNELAVLSGLADLGVALEQDSASAIQAGVINIFGGNLFGSN